MPGPRVHLIAIDRDCVGLLQHGIGSFAEAHGVSCEDAGEHARSVIAMTPERMLDAGVWGTFFVADADARRLVGACGFKSAPDAASTIEIAYFTFPPFERRGYAKAMTRALTERALGSGAVGRVIAHTMPETNASTRILESCGFAHAGEVIDPEDGKVWRWQHAPT